MGHRAIRKIDCVVQKSLISVISIGELTKIGDSDALTFFSETMEKIALPEVNSFFYFYFGDEGNHWSNKADSKVGPFFSRRRATELLSKSGGPRSNGPCKLSKNTKWATVPKRLRTTGLDV